MLRDILKWRVQLLPYLAKEMRKNFNLGVSYFRPLYYDFPNEDMAYNSLTIDGVYS